jgi:hypothetical protein
MMNKTKRKCAALGILAFASILAFDMDWPSKDGILISNFGSNESGHPLQINSYRSEGPIYPADSGELVFYRDESNSANRFPSPLGSWIALDQGNNFIGVYGRFDESTVTPLTTIAEKGSILASSGASGWAAESGFAFGFFDRKERCWVNPSLLITPAEDDKPPVIRQVQLRGSSGNLVNLAQAKNIAQGSYTVLVDAYDNEGARSEALAPARIICSLNGVAEKELKFEYMMAKDGKRMVYRNGLEDAAAVYKSFPSYELGELRFARGQAALIIEVFDISNNSRSATYRLTVD